MRDFSAVHIGRFWFALGLGQLCGRKIRDDCQAICILALARWWFRDSFRIVWGTLWTGYRVHHGLGTGFNLDGAHRSPSLCIWFAGQFEHRNFGQYHLVNDGVTV